MDRFDWNNFDDDFINGIAYSKKTPRSLRPSRKTSDKEMLIPTLESIAQVPNAAFVERYRQEIEQIFLRKQRDIVRQIYQKLDLSRATNYLGMINDLSQMPLGSRLTDLYLTVLNDIGYSIGNLELCSVFAKPITIDIAKSQASELPLYDFQETAINHLEDHFIKHDRPSGLLVMPTGSGKTRTATYFLLKYMISEGYQVIWLTHRHMLIDQTADSFYNHAPLIKLMRPETKLFKMACVSGEHSSIRATEKDDHVMILSVQSTCRNLDYLRSILGKKVIMVVDEAHHTVAQSYQNTIKHVRKLRKNSKLLGLTATPVRSDDAESRFLFKLFDNHVIYDIPMIELIKRQILADPEFERIETGDDFEPIMSVDEVRLTKKYGELPATLIDKIAHASKRNQLIVDTYLKNKARYGKTLIFALNAYHCLTLCDELQKNGIRSDFIYSGQKDNEAKIRRFKKGELDVLVNINILTEGSDVPDIQTVFLTRPTQSEGLLMQMIGRGMRGIQAGGTEKAIIVDFCDKWDIFNKWLNPAWVMGESEAPEIRQNSETKPMVSIPFDLIRDIYHGISFGPGRGIYHVSLPYGWYQLFDEDGEDYSLLVWEEQVPSYVKIMRDRADIQSNPTISPNDIRMKYFGGFGLKPSVEEIGFLINAIRENETGMPHLFHLAERNEIDPFRVSERLKQEKVGANDLKDWVFKIYQKHEHLAEQLFNNFDCYFDRVLDALKGRKITFSEIKEIPIELLPFKIEPTHDLNVLAQEVIDEMFGGHYSGIKSIEWTKDIVSRYYGCYNVDGSIQINRLLDSPQVNREVVKFIIYHEMLHRDNYRHNPVFYAQEHKYPDYTEHNRFLDYQMNHIKLDFGEFTM